MQVSLAVRARDKELSHVNDLQHEEIHP